MRIAVSPLAGIGAPVAWISASMNEPLTVIVTVTATDKGGLTAERTFRVVVNAPPAAGAHTIMITKWAGTAAARLAFDLAANNFYVKDPEGGTLVFHMTDESRAPHPAVTAEITSAGALTLTRGQQPGMRTLTVRAYEPATIHDAEGAAGADGVGQWHDLTFVVDSRPME